MSKNKLDELFRKKLKQREFTPSEAAWSDMSKQLDAGKGGASSGKWAWSILAALLMCGAIYWSMDTERVKVGGPQVEGQVAQLEPDHASSEVEIALRENEGQGGIPESGESQNSRDPHKTDAIGHSVPEEIDGKDASAKGTSTIDYVGGNEVAQAVNASAGEESAHTSHGAEPSRQVAQSSEAGTSPTDEFAIAGADPSNAGQDKGMEKPIDDEGKGLPEVRSTNGKELSNLDSRSGSGSQLEDAKGDRSLDRANEPIDPNTGRSSSERRVSDNPSLMQENALIRMELLSPTLNSLREEFPLLRPEMNALENYAKDRKTWEIGISPYLGMDRVSKTLESKNPEWSATASYRVAHESAIWTPTFGVEFVAMRNGLGLSTGFSIAEYGESVEYQDFLTDSVTYETSTEIFYIDTTFYDFIVDTFGVVIDTIITTEVLDSIIVTTTDSTTYTSSDDRSRGNGTTSLSYYEIPLILSYTFDKGRWSLTPRAGVALGILKGYKGNYLGVDGALVEVGTRETVLSTTLLKIIYGAQLGYELTDRLGAQVGILVKRDLGSVFEEKDYLQKYTSTSYRIGLRYFIGKR